MDVLQANNHPDPTPNSDGGNADVGGAITAAPGVTEYFHDAFRVTQYDGHGSFSAKTFFVSFDNLAPTVDLNTTVDPNGNLIHPNPNFTSGTPPPTTCLDVDRRRHVNDRQHLVYLFSARTGPGCHLLAQYQSGRCKRTHAYYPNGGCHVCNQFEYPGIRSGRYNPTGPWAGRSPSTKTPVRSSGRRTTRMSHGPPTPRQGNSYPQTYILTSSRFRLTTITPTTVYRGRLPVTKANFPRLSISTSR